MADKLYPLVFKPGILRDGTPFQGEYCTNGQWIRWQRGNVRKIGGMQGFNVAFSTTPELPTFYLLQQSNAKLWIYLINNKQVNVYQAENFLINNAPNIITNITANGLDLDATTLCQILPIISNLAPPKQLLFFVAKNYLTNINSTEAGALYTIAPYTNNLNGMQPVDSTLDDGQTIPSGGFCYSNPYLFLYGSDGVVLCSSSTKDVFNFKTSGDRLSGGSTITISTDKVVYGTPIRGGDTSPTLLFWTLSSVVRVTNTGPLATGQIDVFKPNIISQSCSIMSSRCVVEYDGLFFWPGTDRFFFYNGQVQEISNVMNLNYFFDNIDMNKRQLVYGVPNLKYGEIWWFYPEIVNAGNKTIGCTRAVIYNVRENTWYDTAITRDSGMLLESDGSMYTFGKSLANPMDTNKYLYKHEVATDETIALSPPTVRFLGGVASSNIETTNDGLGGGIANNAFDSNPLTACTQTIEGQGNIMYDYGGNPATINRIGLLTSSTITNTIRASIQSSNDLIAWQDIVPLQQMTLTPNQVLIFELMQVTAQAYRLISENLPLLNIAEIYFNGPPSDNIQNSVSPIFSYFTTPIFSWASFSPLKGNDGIDRAVQLKRIEPDMKMNDPAQSLTLIINTQIYAQSRVYSDTKIPFTGGTPKIDYMVQGRQMSFTVSSTNFFEMGHWFMLLTVGDGR